MKDRRVTLKSLALTLAVLLVAISVVPAFAADGDLPIPESSIVAGVTVGGADVGGLTASAAHDVIVAASADTSFPPIPVVAGVRSFTLEPRGALVLDVDGLVADALAATEAIPLSLRYRVSGSALATLVTGIASATDRKAVDAKRSVSHRRLKLSASVVGRKLDRDASVTALTAALSAIATGSAPATVTLPVKAVAPKVTSKNIGKTIIVSLHEFRVFLYNGAKVEKSYRCAIGMRAYPTPVGTFKVIAKSPAPTWRNPYSSWSRTMPAVIKPGYYNPLGLRALYLNAPGIRIHGTSKSWSMGRAASHGCIRLTNHSVVDIYPRVKVGTPVYIVK